MNNKLPNKPITFASPRTLPGIEGEETKSEEILNDDELIDQEALLLAKRCSEFIQKVHELCPKHTSPPASDLWGNMDYCYHLQTMAAPKRTMNKCLKRARTENKKCPWWDGAKAAIDPPNMIERP